MSLIQRNVIPILVLLAVIGVGVTIFAVTSPFASGQETDTCDPGIGISIATTNASGQTVAVVNHGDDIYYSVKLFKEATLCDFGGGTLTISLPGPTGDYTDGRVEIPLTEIVTLENSFNSQRIQYIVNQNDGVQANTDDIGSVELTVRVVYDGGSSFEADGSELPNEVDATATSILRIEAPSVEIEISPSVGDPSNPDSQSVLQDQTAYFDVVIRNRGGFELSNISVASLEDAGAGEVRVAGCERAANEFGSLAVGASTSTYQCGTTTEATFVQRVEVTAYGTALSTSGETAQLEVTDDDTTVVFFGTVQVGTAIVNLPGFDIVRYTGAAGDDEGAFTITPETPSASDLESVSITVNIFEGDVTGYPEDLAEYTLRAANDCERNLGTVAAGTMSADQEYDCTGKMYQGLNSIWATIEGTIPGTTTLLRERALTQVETIIPGLSITLTPVDQIIRNGNSTTITVNVINDGLADLTGVEVVDPNPNNDDGLAIGPCVTNPDGEQISLAGIGDLNAGDSIEIECSTGTLTVETRYEAVAIGTARDNTTEPSGVAIAVVRILSPSTDVSVALLEGGSTVVQLVVQTVVVTETNDGDSDLTRVYVDLGAAGIGPNLTGKVLTRESPEFVGSRGEAANDDDVLNPGETWEWRVVVIGVAGNVVLLEPDATSIDVTASGYGTDALGIAVNPDTHAEEIETQTFPFAVN